MNLGERCPKRPVDMLPDSTEASWGKKRPQANKFFNGANSIKIIHFLEIFQYLYPLETFKIRICLVSQGLGVLAKSHPYQDI